MEDYTYERPALNWSLTNRWPEIAVLLGWLLLAAGLVAFSRNLSVLDKH